MSPAARPWLTTTSCHPAAARPSPAASGRWSASPRRFSDQDRVPPHRQTPPAASAGWIASAPAWRRAGSLSTSRTRTNCPGQKMRSALSSRARSLIVPVPLCTGVVQKLQCADPRFAGVVGGSDYDARVRGAMVRIPAWPGGSGGDFRSRPRRRLLRGRGRRDRSAVDPRPGAEADPCSRPSQIQRRFRLVHLEILPDLR